MNTLDINGVNKTQLYGKQAQPVQQGDYEILFTLLLKYHICLDIIAKLCWTHGEATKLYSTKSGV